MIIRESSYGALEDAVNHMITLGWKPIGSICCGWIRFYQAMTKTVNYPDE